MAAGQRGAQVQHAAARRRLAEGDAGLARRSRCRSASARRSSSRSSRRRGCARSSSRPSSCSPGVPSVVIGFFALIVLATWVQTAFGTEHRLNALVAGIGLSFAICPIVFSVSEDALRAVPELVPRGRARARLDAGADGPARRPARGRRRASRPSVVLGFGRAIGETMIVVIASGNAALLDAEPRALDAHHHRHHRAGARRGRRRQRRTTTCSSPSARCSSSPPSSSTSSASASSTACAGSWGSSRDRRRARRRARSLVGARPPRRPRAGDADRAARGVIILAMLAIVLVDVVAGRRRTLSLGVPQRSRPRDGMTAGGIFPAIFGTVALTLLMTIAAVPAGVATAIYLTEYASAAVARRPRSSASASRTSRACRRSSSASSASGSSSRRSGEAIDTRRLRRADRLRQAVPPLGVAHAGHPHAAGRRRRDRGGAPRRSRASCARRAWRSARPSCRRSCASSCPRRSAAS